VVKLRLQIRNEIWFWLTTEPFPETQKIPADRISLKILWKFGRFHAKDPRSSKTDTPNVAEIGAW